MKDQSTKRSNENNCEFSFKRSSPAKIFVTVLSAILLVSVVFSSVPFSLVSKGVSGIVDGISSVASASGNGDSSSGNGSGSGDSSSGNGSGSGDSSSGNGSGSGDSSSGNGSGSGDSSSGNGSGSGNSSSGDGTPTSVVIGKYKYNGFSYDVVNNTVIIRYSKLTGSVAIPSKINGIPVVAIGDYAFYETNITNITIPTSVTEIGKGAFYKCSSLVTVRVPSSVDSIGAYAFDHCIRATVSCYPGSYTEGYVKSYGFPYRHISTAKTVTIKTLPSKDTYAVNETLDTTGLELNVTYKDSTTAVVKRGFTVSSYNFSTVGRKRVTVSLSDISASFYVTVIAQIPDYPESSHPYSSNYSNTWNYVHPTSASKLRVSFSSDTFTETGYDYIYIYDYNGNEIGRYTGNALKGVTIEVPGNSFSIKLKTDSSVTYYGFKIIDIDGNCNHVFSNYVYNEDATCTSDGTKTADCIYGCGASDTVTAEGTKLNHRYVNYQYNNDATCLSNGTKTAYCIYGCGNAHTITAEGTKVAHSYINYVYNEDATCTSDGTKTAECIYGCGSENTITAEDTRISHKFGRYTYNEDATCTSDGTKSAVCTYGCGKIYTVTATGTKLDHSFTTYKYNNDATCMADGTKTANCTYGCGTKDTITAQGTKLDHEFVNYSFNNDATCIADGTKTAKCSYGCGRTHTIAAVGTKTAHKFEGYSYNNDATCQKDGTMTAFCIYKCGASDTKTLPGTKLDHTYHAEVLVEAKCETEGKLIYICDCGDNYVTSVPAIGHLFADYKYNNDATCTKDGTKTAHCGHTGCTETDTVAAAGTKTGHSYGSWTVTLDPTPVEDGIEERVCRKCGVKETRSIPKTYVNNFVDVNDRSWYADAVGYVVGMGYMSGMSDTKFSPNSNITREQFVLILANIAGAETDQYKNVNSGFTDIKTGKWYSGAVTWAVREGYISGVSATKFGRGQSIQRGALARILYNYAEKNGKDVSGRASLSSFGDAALFNKSSNAWMKEPIQWAVHAGIISGSRKNGVLYINPRGTATRAQAAVMISTFEALD